MSVVNDDVVVVILEVELENNHNSDRRVLYM